jgi:hypothetical protein
MAHEGWRTIWHSMLQRIEPRLWKGRVLAELHKAPTLPLRKIVCHPPRPLDATGTF